MMLGYYPNVLPNRIVAVHFGKFIRTGLAAIIAVNSSIAFAIQPIVRESHHVRVGNVVETWRLQWLSQPKPVCTPPDPNWTTCPCSGFELGQSGRLELIRLRRGKEIDRLDLSGYFGGDFPVADGDEAVLPYKPMSETDYMHGEDPMFAARMVKRPMVQVMSFDDYDHDGHETEFVLQTDTEPCGKRYGILIGISAASPKLHVFTSVAHPEQPLELPLWYWDKLRGTAGPLHEVTWHCGDHASDVETELEVEATPKGFRAVSRSFECDDTGNRGALRDETKL